MWRESSSRRNAPTNVIRGVLREYNTPEALEMLSNVLTKQGGSCEHDSQVHVDDAVGYPKYMSNRNAKVMQHCDMGSSVLSTHHWSPLKEEVENITTTQDKERSAFGFPTDCFVFPFVEVSHRFGIIKEKS